MSAQHERFFLFLGHSDSDAPVSKLKTAGVPYRKKLLESGPDNWDKIICLLEEPALRGVIAVANGHIWARFLRDEFRDKSEALFAAMSKVPHIFFVHEAVLRGEATLPDEPAGEDDEFDDWDFRTHFWQPDDEVRAEVQALLRRHTINPTPYRTNAERSVLAISFLDDNERDLLFRVYIPSGRLYAEEADRLLSLFRDWLSQVGRHSVRQGGYRTGAGQVYEFFGDGSLASTDLSREFENFSGFLELCVTNPHAATDRLVSAGLPPSTGAQIVTRYGKEARRLQIDIRHARESRMLAIRHAFETEISDAAEPGPAQTIEALLERLVPEATVGQALRPTVVPARTAQEVTLNFTQQVIGAVHGDVIQSVHGVVNLAPEAQKLLGLVEQLAEEDKAELLSAVHELEDIDARNEDRVRARQKLKGFLFRVASKLESASFTLLQKYLESKLEL